MSDIKSTNLFSEIDSFFKGAQSAKAMHALAGIMGALRLPSKRLLPEKRWNHKFSNAQLFVLFLILPCFAVRNAYNYGRCGLHKMLSAGKDALYRFLSDGRMDWRGVLYAINLQLLAKIQVRSDFKKSGVPVCLMADDTDFPKAGRKAERLGRVFSHVSHSSILGFKCLFLGLTDGKTQTMLDFALLGEQGRNKGKPFGMSKEQAGEQFHKEYGKDEPAGARLAEYGSSKLDLLMGMIRRAIRKGIRFDYLLADSWFACAALVRFIRSRHLKCHYLGMAKMGNTLYAYKGGKATAADIVRKLKKSKAVKYSRKLRCHYSEADVKLAGMDVRLFFCRKGKRGGWSVLITTNPALGFPEAFRIYSMRWSVEVFFKEAKGLLGMGKSQTRSFASQIAAVSIAVLQYNILSVLKRFRSYETLGALFRALDEETMELSVTERIWQAILSVVQAISKIFELDDLLVLEKLINCSDEFANIAALMVKNKAA